MRLDLTDEAEAALLKELNPDPPSSLKTPLRERDMRAAFGQLLAWPRTLAEIAF
jgi:hypothetical protein